MSNPATASRYSKDDDHLAQIIELLGELPTDLSRRAGRSNEFFDEHGKYYFTPLNISGAVDLAS